MIFINFKTYQESTGESALSLARMIVQVSSESSVPIISCPQAVDVRNVIAIAQNQVWVQHVDSFERGRATGWFPPEVAKEAGVEGVLLNHSEHKLSFSELKETVTRARAVGLKILVFADSPREAESVAVLRPDYIGYEPPELIASKDTSVSEAKPEVIEKVVKVVGDVPVLIGAGVKSSKDIRVGLKLGAVGVALASSVVLAQNPKEVLEELVSGFQ